MNRPYRDRTMTTFTAADVEQVAIEWLTAFGCSVATLQLYVL